MAAIALLSAGLWSCEDENLPAAFDENGASYAKFSVANGKQVRFSKGNLQYQASTDTWRFAENQYDCVGNDNQNISPSNTGWIDLFCWGTSGWNSGANAYQPWSTSTHYEDYHPGGSWENDLTGAYAEADWAWHNAISNGGNRAHLWRTLTTEEWQYLLSSRVDASAKRGPATIGDEYHGLLILPDSWTQPKGITFNAHNTNQYGWDEWEKLESAGAIFFPFAGHRSGTDVVYVGTIGLFWSAIHFDEDDAYIVAFYEKNIIPDAYGNRYDGYSVRPVQD